eukprot:CAMPEP_0115129458 /NCGR_PEP_ID=MMETSP0227-20121206/51802_1 /TAXON_ID=89957 /ORGANISM="Polarella glacialis, Strain CCMP 1383" /LENGTH=99 /DNA_ID=CAMNT_0002534329 /DNA_START=353 /DNA_END=648 /DNA_ORIENTATION=+
MTNPLQDDFGGEQKSEDGVEDSKHFRDFILWERSIYLYLHTHDDDVDKDEEKNKHIKLFTRCCQVIVLSLQRSLVLMQFSVVRVLAFAMRSSSISVADL